MKAEIRKLISAQIGQRPTPVFHVNLPPEYIQQLGLKPGDYTQVKLDGSRIIIEKIKLN